MIIIGVHPVIVGMIVIVVSHQVREKGTVIVGIPGLDHVGLEVDLMMEVGEGEIGVGTGVGIGAGATAAAVVEVAVEVGALEGEVDIIDRDPIVVAVGVEVQPVDIVVGAEVQRIIVVEILAIVVVIEDTPTHHKLSMEWGLPIITEDHRL